MKPCGGDIVRLTAPWKWGGMATGSLGIISGFTREVQEGGQDIGSIVEADIISNHGHAQITFNYGVPFLQGVTCSASGGPGTIGTPYEELIPTGETMVIQFKRFTNALCKEVEYFEKEFPVWEWSPKNGY